MHISPRDFVVVCLKFLSLGLPGPSVQWIPPVSSLSVGFYVRYASPSGAFGVGVRRSLGEFCVDLEFAKCWGCTLSA